MEEMFLAKGFNDYLAKPIDISKLNRLMEKWIPKEKRQTAGRTAVLTGDAQVLGFEIEGLDMEKGFAMTGGTEATYREVLERYYRDVNERLPYLRGLPSLEDMQSFVIQVHAIKSASASIGAETLSAKALLLENAGRADDLRVIAEHLPGFRQNLSVLISRIGAALHIDENTEEETNKTVLTVNRETLLKLRTALDQRDIWTIDLLLNELLPESFNHEKQILSKISGSVLIAEFEEAVDLLDKLLGEIDAGGKE
jgi:HPt (histidine-containing phosphotransfer) domain-containing protein